MPNEGDSSKQTPAAVRLNPDYVDLLHICYVMVHVCELLPPDFLTP